MCKLCGLGKYSDDGEQCKQCPAGKLVYRYNQNQSLTVETLNSKRYRGSSINNCSAARSPFYALHEQEFSTQKACSGYGFMTMTNGMSKPDCEKCTPGKMPVRSDVYGAYICENCRAGRYWASQENKATCLHCQKNTYQDETGKTTCKKCFTTLNVKAYTDEIGAANQDTCNSCTSLKNGKYCNSEHNPVTCPVGHYCLSGDASRCNPGKYQDVTGQSVCKNCPSGFATTAQGLASCPKCVQGKYQPEEGQTTCVWCLSGKYADFNADTTNGDGCKSCESSRTANYNRTACEDCATGFFKMGDHCKTCNPGRIATEDNRVCTRPEHYGHEKGEAYVYTCDGECRSDNDADGICNKFEVVPKSGCTDPRSCNFDRNATVDDGNCEDIDNAETCLSKCATGDLTETQCRNQAQYVYTPTNEKTCVLLAKDGKCILTVPGFIHDEGLDRSTSCNDISNATTANEFVEIADVSGTDVTDESYWASICETHGGKVEPGDRMKIVMEGITDYYKPTREMSLCEFLLESDNYPNQANRQWSDDFSYNNRQWSNDASTWYMGYTYVGNNNHIYKYYSQGAYRSTRKHHFGGSDLNWPKENIAGDNRTRVAFWGGKHNSSRGGTNKLPEDGGAWGKPFKMYLKRPIVPRLRHTYSTKKHSQHYACVLGDGTLAPGLRGQSKEACESDSGIWDTKKLKSKTFRQTFQRPAEWDISNDDGSYGLWKAKASVRVGDDNDFVIYPDSDYVFDEACYEDPRCNALPYNYRVTNTFSSRGKFDITINNVALVDGQYETYDKYESPYDCTYRDSEGKIKHTHDAQKLKIPELRNSDNEQCKIVWINDITYKEVVEYYETFQCFNADQSELLDFRDIWNNRTYFSSTEECSSKGEWKAVRTFCQNNPDISTEELCFDKQNACDEYECVSSDNSRLFGGRHLNKQSCEKNTFLWQSGFCYNEHGLFENYWSKKACENMGRWQCRRYCLNANTDDYGNVHFNEPQCEKTGCGDQQNTVTVDVCGDFTLDLCRQADLPQCYVNNNTCVRVRGSVLQTASWEAKSEFNVASDELARKEFEYEITESKALYAYTMYEQYTRDRLLVALKFNEDGFTGVLRETTNDATTTKGDQPHEEVAFYIEHDNASATGNLRNLEFEYGWQVDSHYRRSIGEENYNIQATRLQYNDTPSGYYRTAFILFEYSKTQENLLTGINNSITTYQTNKDSKQAARILAQARYDNSFNNTIHGRTCSDPTACNFCVNTDSYNFCPFAFCRYAKKGRVCAGECRDPNLCNLKGLEGECIRDQINPRDNKCDEEETMGCMDRRACNYNPRATYTGYRKCQYPPPFRKCKKPYLTDSEIEDTQAYINEIEHRANRSHDIWSQALSEMVSTLALLDMQYVENSGCGSGLINKCENGPTLTTCQNYLNNLEPYPDAATADEIVQNITYEEGVNLYDDDSLRPWFLMHVADIAPAINSTYLKFLNVLEDVDQDVRLASCAAFYVHHQQAFKAAQKSNATYLLEKSVHDTLQEDIQRAQDDLDSFLWFRDEKANLTKTKNDTLTHAVQAKYYASRINNEFSTAQKQYNTAKNDYDLASDRFELAQEDLTFAENAAENQHFLLDNLPVDWTNNTSWSAWLTTLSATESIQASGILESYEALEARLNTSLGSYNANKTDVTNKKDAFQVKTALYETASSLLDAAIQSNDTYWSNYDEAALNLWRKQNEHDLSTANSCIHDKDGDGTCDEEDAHAACALRKSDSRQEFEYTGVCNGRPAGTKRTKECNYCETGKYTESVCTNADDQTLVDTHTYDGDGTTAVGGDCTNPLVDTEWLNQYYCLDCPAGWFGKAGSRSCAKCEVGTYQDETGKPGCKLCRFGVKVQQYEGSTSCNDCDGDADPPYGNDAHGNCEVCDPAAGRVLDRVTGACGFKICPRGQGVGQDGECEPCVFGETYSATASNAPCLPVWNCTDENGDETPPSVISLTKAPACINENTTLMDSILTLKVRVQLCVQDSNCDSVLPALDTSTLGVLDGVFKNMLYFNIDVGGWRTSNAISMESMFEGATQFDQDVGGWDTSKVQSMKNMFKKAVNFNHNIEDWNTRRVTDMSGMFYGATHFDQDLNEWNLNSLKSADHMFYDAAVFNGLMPTSPPYLESFQGMFRGTNYNRDLYEFFPAIVRTWNYTREEGPCYELTQDGESCRTFYDNQKTIRPSESLGCLSHRRADGCTTDCYESYYHLIWECEYRWSNSYDLSSVLPDSYQKQLKVEIKYDAGGGITPLGLQRMTLTAA